jgi:steroid delta-isomerase-like uncharacterized protein
MMDAAMEVRSLGADRNDGLILAWANAWSSTDVDQLLALFTEDCIYEEVPTGIVNRGKEQVRTFALALWDAIESLKITPKRIMASSAGATVEWTMTGRPQKEFPGLPTSNPAIRVRGLSMFVFNKGKIERVSDYWDLATSGVVPVIPV